MFHEYTDHFKSIYEELEPGYFVGKFLSRRVVLTRHPRCEFLMVNATMLCTNVGTRDVNVWLSDPATEEYLVHLLDVVNEDVAAPNWARREDMVVMDDIGPHPGVYIHERLLVELYLWCSTNEMKLDMSDIVYEYNTDEYKGFIEHATIKYFKRKLDSILV